MQAEAADLLASATAQAEQLAKLDAAVGVTAGQQGSCLAWVGSQSVPDTAHAAAVNTNALASACISCNTIPPASTLPPQTASIAQLQEQQLPPAGPASSTPALALTYLEDVLESAGARPLCCSTLCQLQLTARWLWAQPQGLAQAVPAPVVFTAHV